MKKILSIFKSKVKQAVPGFVRLFGANLLTKEATLAKLKQYEISANLGEELIISPAGDTGLQLPDVFYETQLIKTSSVFVYQIIGNTKINIYPYGGFKLDGDVLNIDFGSALFIKTLFRPDTRVKLKCEICIVLWSHYWHYSYYDYVFFVLAKLLRIKAIINENEFKRAKIVYPLLNNTFEKELMAYAGVSIDQLIDSRSYNVIANHYYLGNSDTYYFHNRQDLQFLKETLASVKTPVFTSDRIYIQRKGRRKIVNEDEIINVLSNFNFIVIEDKPRSIAEQIAIYRNAKIVIGSHGASFTNIMNCIPGTILIELFGNNYYPEFFRCLALVLQLKYFIICQEKIQESHYRNVDEDFTIEPANLKFALEQILAER